MDTAPFLQVWYFLLRLLCKLVLIVFRIGSGVAGFSGDLGQATSATLSKPKRVFSTTTGNVYISDYG